MVLSGCSSRDEVLAEKIAAAEAAAQRAEFAAVRAENAANKAAPETKPSPMVVEAEDEPSAEETVVEHDPNEPPNPAVANNPLPPSG